MRLAYCSATSTNVDWLSFIHLSSNYHDHATLCGVKAMTLPNDGPWDAPESIICTIMHAVATVDAQSSHSSNLHISLPPTLVLKMMACPKKEPTCFGFLVAAGHCNTLRRLTVGHASKIVPAPLHNSGLSNFRRVKSTTPKVAVVLAVSLVAPQRNSRQIQPSSIHKS